MKRKIFAILIICLLISGCAGNQPVQPAHPDFPVIRITTIGETSREACDRISLALSSITRESLGCDIRIEMISHSEYDNMVDNLILDNNLTDVFVCNNRTTMNKLTNGNYIYRLDRYLAGHEKLVERIKDEQSWDQVKYGKYTYGIPFSNDTSCSWGFIMRKDICNDIAVDPEKIHNLKNLHEALVKVRDAYPDLIPVASARGEMKVFAERELLYAQGGYLYTDTGCESICDMPAFADRCEMMREWYDEGLIQKDSWVTNEGITEWINNDLAFGAFVCARNSGINELNYKSEYDLVFARLDDVFYGDDVTDMSFVINAYSQEPDLCLKVLELIYNDQKLLGLCILGEEGTDYRINEEGFAEPLVYGEKLYTNFNWPLKQESVSILGPDENYIRENEDKDAFLFDNASVLNNIYQCGEVIDKYLCILSSGRLDPQGGIALFSEEMKDYKKNILIQLNIQHK